MLGASKLGASGIITGGTRYIKNGNVYYVFTSSDVLNILDRPQKVDILMISGGGGGANANNDYGGGCGGDSGNKKIYRDQILQPGNYTIVIGAGGDSNANGSATTFTGTTQADGGARGYAAGDSGSLFGGYGAGGMYSGRSGGSGIQDPWQEIDFAGSLGQDGYRWFAAGGGAGPSFGTGGAVGSGGNYGAPNGGFYTAGDYANSGDANTGHGGGGHGSRSGYTTGWAGQGGSGIVIVRVK